MLDNASPLVIGVVGLVRSRTRQSYGYFEEVLQGIISEAGNVDADVHIYRDDSWLWSGGKPPYSDGVACGLILFSTACKPDVYGVVASSGLPIVSVGENLIASNMSSIDVDNHGASKAATEHLIKQGHTRIGILSGRLTGDGWARLRFAGYVDALEQAGIPLDEALVADVSILGFDGGYEAACLMLQTVPAPTAIVALNDDIALGAMTRISEVGLRVPEDVSIIGFDDVHRAEHANPPLTTIRQPTQLIGVKAVGQLIKHVANRHIEPVQMMVPGELILRASTSAPGFLRAAKAA